MAEQNNPLKDLLKDLLEKGFDKSTCDGIIIGMNEAVSILNQFIDIKVQRNSPPCLTKEELSVFSAVYIAEVKKSFEEKNNK